MDRVGLTGVPECPKCQQLCRPLALAAEPQASGRWGVGKGWTGRAQAGACHVGEPDRDRDAAPAGGCSRKSGRAHTLHLCCPLAWATQTRYVPCPRLGSPGPGRSVSCWWSLTVTVTRRLQPQERPGPGPGAGPHAAFVSPTRPRRAVAAARAGGPTRCICAAPLRGRHKPATCPAPAWAAQAQAGACHVGGA